jgi:hypothetical protein
MPAISKLCENCRAKRRGRPTITADPAINGADEKLHNLSSGSHDQDSCKIVQMDGAELPAVASARKDRQLTPQH